MTYWGDSFKIAGLSQNGTELPILNIFMFCNTSGRSFVANDKNIDTLHRQFYGKKFPIEISHLNVGSYASETTRRRLMTEFMTTQGVCRRLLVHRTTVYRWIKKGLFPKPFKMGRQNRWPTVDVDAWVEEARIEKPWRYR